MSNNIVAYIDLLAFSNHLKDNLRDALMSMNNFNTILSTKILDELINPISTYPGGLKELAQIHSINSFDYFLPFSDSVFLMSKDCNTFIKQLGNFVLESFTISSHFYKNPLDPASPEKGSIINYSIGEDGALQTINDTCNYYPVLFRGGLSYGEAFPIDLFNINNKTFQKSKVITGKAVVEAVALESKVKGPRLIFSTTVFDQLEHDANDYCRAIPEDNGFYEILWPAMKFITQNNRFLNKQEFDRFYDLAKPIYNLLKAYNQTPYSIHYFNFIELIIASTIQFFDKKCYLKEFAKQKIASWIKGNDLKDKIDLSIY